MSDRTVEYDGDGIRPILDLQKRERGGRAGLVAAQTGRVLMGVDLELEVNYLSQLLQRGYWIAAALRVMQQLDHDERRMYSGLFEQLELDSTVREIAPSPIHHAILENRLRVHLRQGEWLLAALMLERERIQAADDVENGEPQDTVKVHRTHPHNHLSRRD